MRFALLLDQVYDGDIEAQKQNKWQGYGAKRSNIEPGIVGNFQFAKIKKMNFLM